MDRQTGGYKKFERTELWMMDRKTGQVPKLLLKLKKTEWWMIFLLQST